MKKINKMSSFPFCSYFTSHSSYFSWPIIVGQGVQFKIDKPLIRHFSSSSLKKKSSGGGGSTSWWVGRQSNDPYVQQRQKDDYRCRSAYKLLQLNNKFNFLQPGATVMDCGCCPGSWSQVAAKLVNGNGLRNPNLPPGYVVGCDLLHVEPVPGTTLLSKHDFTHLDTQENLLELVNHRPFDVVLSDMAPIKTGNKSLEHDGIMKLARMVRDFTLANGASECCMVIKVFQGPLVNPFMEDLKTKFVQVKMTKPKASREESSEAYVIAKKLKKIE